MSPTLRKRRSLGDLPVTPVQTRRASLGQREDRKSKGDEENLAYPLEPLGPECKQAIESELQASCVADGKEEPAAPLLTTPSSRKKKKKGKEVDQENSENRREDETAYPTSSSKKKRKRETDQEAWLWCVDCSKVTATNVRDDPDRLLLGGGEACQASNHRVLDPDVARAELERWLLKGRDMVAQAQMALDKLHTVEELQAQKLIATVRRSGSDLNHFGGGEICIAVAAKRVSDAKLDALCAALDGLALEAARDAVWCAGEGFAAIYRNLPHRPEGVVLKEGAILVHKEDQSRFILNFFTRKLHADKGAYTKVFGYVVGDLEPLFVYRCGGSCGEGVKCHYCHGNDVAPHGILEDVKRDSSSSSRV